MHSPLTEHDTQSDCDQLIVGRRALRTLGAVLLIFLLFSVDSQARVIRVLDDNSQQDESIDYFRSLLTQALDVTKRDYGDYTLQRMFLAFSQDRTMQLLKSSKYLDVMHSMSSSKREDEFLAIKIPLLKGLMGKRMLLVHKSKVAEFVAIKNIAELQKKLACQGLHWPDADILELNDFNIARVSVFESIFDMVEKKRCDYFPRGLPEIFSELESFKKTRPDLAIVPNVMISYPAPVYFFVSKNNRKLAERIEIGLKRMQENGTFDIMLREHVLTRQVFPLEQWQDATIFNIENPILPEIEPEILEHYWLKLGVGSSN